jgi:hypothetical protein
MARQFVEQGIVFGVCYLRRIQHMVSMQMMVELVAQQYHPP